MLCPQCQHANPNGQKFCGECGAKLNAAPVTPAPVPPVAERREARPPQPAEAERKLVTIMFADISGFTTLAEQMDPEHVRSLTNACFEHLVPSIEKYSGTIDKFIGDAVVALFGAPTTRENDPERAVYAALEMMESLQTFNAQRGLDLGLHIGLNTGLVVAGGIGSSGRQQYSVMGDAVNLAARLEDISERGQILIGAATHRLIAPLFECRSLGPIQVKGREQATEVYAVLSASVTPGRTRGIAGLTAPLVGRDAEFAALQTSLSALRGGQGQIVTIIGEAGLGKSRLVEEGRKWMLEGRGQTSEVGSQKSAAPTSDHLPPTSNWLEGRALSYGLTLSFWTIIQLIKADLGLSDASDEAQIRVRLRERGHDLFGVRWGEIWPYLLTLLALKLDPADAERIRQLDGETLKRQTLVSVAAYVERLARRQPTVLVFEDLHWADPSTLDTLETLLPLTRTVPLLILCPMRAELDHASWRMRERFAQDYRANYTEITLRPLSSAEAEQLVGHLLVIADLPPSIRQLIQNKAEGNPFYLEEVIRSLIDQGYIVREAEHWRATAAIANITVPDTLQGVLLARIDRLEESVRHTLQLASVIGRSFLYRLLTAITEAERQVDQHLTELQRVDLVREHARRPELEYIFKHSLTQEAAYQSLLVERRREFHRKVGEALEHLFGSRLEEFYPMLAHHFALAEDRPKASEYLISAGDRARLQDAHEESIEHYKRALPVLMALDDHERAARTWFKLALVYHANFDFDAAHEANEQAFALSKEHSPVDPVPPRALRSAKIISGLPFPSSFDPGLVFWVHDRQVVKNTFVGLAEVDLELNVVPHLARSWQVLDDGTRYLIHLRPNLRWSDGSPLTARDFEWAWKRNLSIRHIETMARLLNDVVGAQAYHAGETTDPDTVGVRALDDLTLEVRLTAPVAYFPYLFADSITAPLPRAVIEQHGDAWIEAEHVVSNGPYRYVSRTKNKIVLERNPYYLGELPGNVEELEFHLFGNDDDRLALFKQSGIDVWSDARADAETPSGYQSLLTLQNSFNVNFIVFNLSIAPFDDVRVRRAIAHAINQVALVEQAYVLWRPALGGIVPIGIPGHSPNLALPFDLERARQYLVEAGYPEGRGLPLIKFPVPGHTAHPGAEALAAQLRQIGLELNLETIPANSIPNDYPLIRVGWGADVPDPDNFMRHAEWRTFAKQHGWHDPFYEDWIERAGRMPNRAQRMAVYRELDRRIVAEQVLIIPLTYSGHTRLLLRDAVTPAKFYFPGYSRFGELQID